MGVLSFLFGDDARLRLMLPPREHALALAWMRYPGRAPDVPALLRLASRFVEERAEDPFRARLRRALAEDGLTFEIQERREAPDPPMEAIERFSEPGWEERYAECTHVIGVRAIADASWPPVAEWLAHAGAAGIAAAAEGLVMDPAIPRFLAGTGIDGIPGDGRYLLADHLAVSLSPERDGRGWMTTLGMARFQLPEIELRDLPLDLGERAAWLVRSVALRILDAAVNAPVDDDEEARQLEMDAELALRPGDVAAARGEEDAGAGAFQRPALVRLRLRSARRGPGFVTVMPQGDAPDADARLRSVLEALCV